MCVIFKSKVMTSHVSTSVLELTVVPLMSSSLSEVRRNSSVSGTVPPGVCVLCIMDGFPLPPLLRLSG